MTTKFWTSGLAVAAVAAVLAVPAHADDWTVTPLATGGWSAQEQGSAEEPGSYSVKLVYETPDVAFSLGCTMGYGLSIAWDPQTDLNGGILIPVKFSIDGEMLFERDIANNDRRDYSWLERGDASDAATLVYAIWEKDKGTLTIEGGGATSTIPFNESANDYWSEQVLDACGLF